jgi:predicted Zn-dependent protease
MKDETELRSVLENDPGDPAFAELAELLREQDRLLEAKEICFAGLSVNPGCNRGRLVLARIFWQQKQIPFCIRELEAIKQELPDNLAVAKLLARLSPAADAAFCKSSGLGKEDGTIAEAEFDLDDVEALDTD